jgi:hypothetical protein
MNTMWPTEHTEHTETQATGTDHSQVDWLAAVLPPFRVFRGQICPNDCLWSHGLD